MARIGLVCRDCGHSFEVLTRVAIRDRQKVCLGCGSANTRQTLSSYLRNGALSDPDCGGVRPSSGFG